MRNLNINEGEKASPTVDSMFSDQMIFSEIGRLMFCSVRRDHYLFPGNERSARLFLHDSTIRGYHA